MRKSKLHYINCLIQALKALKTNKSLKASQFFSRYPQSTINSMNDNASPQGINLERSIIATTAISKIQLDNALKNSLTSALRNEVPYSEILTQLEGKHEADH